MDWIVSENNEVVASFKVREAAKAFVQSQYCLDNHPNAKISSIPTLLQNS